MLVVLIVLFEWIVKGLLGYKEFSVFMLILILIF